MKTKGRFSNPFSAVLTGIADRAGKKGKIHVLKETERLDGKSCLVTGANSGLGFGITVLLARRGAHVIMACRKEYQEVLEKAKNLSGSDNIELRILNLIEVDSINKLVDGLKKDNIHIDVSIHNAGVTPPKARKIRNGLDEMFMVNYLSKFILVNGLIDKGVIRTRPLNTENGMSFPRIIFISSDSHRGASAIDLSALGTFEPYKDANRGVSLYSYNKLILNTYVVELSRRLVINQEPSILVYSICPGPVDTNIIRDAPWLLRIFLRLVFKVFFKSPLSAAEPVVYVAASSEINGKSGEYLHMNQSKKMDEKCYSIKQGSILWKRSVELASSIQI